MSEGLSRQDLLDRLKESKLLSAEELKRVEAIDPGADGRVLGKAIVAAGILTSFQVDEVIQQRFDRLQIGNYEILDKLGTGGTGTVFKARHRRMKRIVALKVLARNLCKDKSFVQRFQREVETIAQLSHPNIVMAHDADEAKIGHYLVMEFVSGQDLTSLVQKQGPMPLGEALNCIVQAARGLGYVHEQGMIHRDIKPANLLRDEAGRVKVTDLGLARFSSGAGGAVNVNAVTQAGGVLGSVDYMSPEQALDSTTIDHRSDIYSLGGTFYYVLSGRAPYPGQTMMETLLKHRDAPIPSVAALRDDVPASVDAVIARMMAKTVKERYQSMADVVADLEKIQANLSNSAVSAPAGLFTPPRRDHDSYAGMPKSPRDTVFPRSPADQTMDLAPAPSTPNASISVLVVEQSRTQARIIRGYLHSQNIDQVVAVKSGHEALKMIKSVSPDAVISSMHLEDMTGVELARQLRADSQGPRPGFVLLHSEAELPESKALSQSKQAIALQKPYTSAQLVEALSVVTGQQLVALPASEEERAMTLTRPLMMKLPPRAARPYAERRVLIVDDDPSARGLARRLLTDLGVGHLSEAKDGAEAVATLARASFDLVITDDNMPLMDGRSLVKFLKANPATASVPVIMVVTDSDPDRRPAIGKEGVAAISDQSLHVELVQRVLDQMPQPS